MPTFAPRVARIALGLCVALSAVGGLGAGPVRAMAAPLELAEATPHAPGPAVLLSHGARTKRVVALTFDDGYNPATCSALVDILVQSATPATFLPNAVNVVRTPALWKRIAALGFPIGNHTSTHPYMPGLSYEDQLAQIESDRHLVEGVIGGPSLLVFRPPYGAFSPATLLAARRAGYSIVLNWDVSFADSSRRANGLPWPVTSYVRAASSGTAGSVVLGHCGSQIDVDALPAVIAAYRSRGFTFVTVPELLGMAGATPMHFPVAASPSTSPPPASGSPLPTGQIPASPSPSGAMPSDVPGAGSTPGQSPMSTTLGPSPVPSEGVAPSPQPSPDLDGVPQRWVSRVRVLRIS